MIREIKERTRRRKRQRDRLPDYCAKRHAEPIDWLDRTVKVPTTLASLTRDLWVDEFERLKKLLQRSL
jgi:hypothetical protein